MKHKQPDRFERIATHEARGAWNYSKEAEIVPVERVADLLRKEHNAVVLMVKQNPLFGAKNTEFKQGYTQACQDILDQLANMRA